jgi:hypothetical protein
MLVLHVVWRHLSNWCDTIKKTKFVLGKAVPHPHSEAAA